MKTTIRMPKESLKKWLDALRSGKYAQGKHRLWTPGSNTFCCLGVMEHCLTGEVDMEHVGSALSPHLATLERLGIQFLKDDGFPGGKEPLLRYGENESDIAVASHLNDSGDYDFKALADLIEAHTETF